MLLLIGPREHLEPVAPDPQGKGPLRWFEFEGFDENAMDRRPGSTRRSARRTTGNDVEGLSRAEALVGHTTGDGRRPCSGTHPMLIDRKARQHPADNLSDQGIRLARSEQLDAGGGRASFVHAFAPIAATLITPGDEVVL